MGAASGTTPATDDGGDRNEVVLLGRLAAAPAQRQLPSGDEIIQFRVIVRRSPPRKRLDSTPVGAGLGGRATVDTVDCTGWRGDVKRSVGAWQPGDIVEVTGALRRRFWRFPAGSASRYDVEVLRARRVRRRDP